MITLYLNVNLNEITWNKGDYLLAAAKRLGIEASVLRYNSGENIVPEYVLNIEPFDTLVTGTKWTGIWEIDVMLDRQEMSIDKWTHCDTVFVANNSYPDRIKSFQGNLITMFQACDPELHRRRHEIVQNYDFIFSGTNGLEIYRERERIIDLLRNKDFTFMDFGKGHSPEKYVEFLNMARVQVIRSGSKLPIANSQVEQRFFECLAIGPVLKDYAPDLEKLGLVEGEDFFWFKDDNELLYKMNLLIKNPDLRDRMASNGRRKALLYHTYENRLASIINFAKEYSR